MGLQAHSLLPYLDESPGTLRIRLVAQDLPTLQKVPFPFFVLSDADPFSLLIDARFVTDAGSELKKVFLLVQRDTYAVGNAGLRPVTNRDIEHAWQKAYDVYLRSKFAPPPVVISGQIAESGTAVPIQPVFYCKQTATYFHPPCPHCGRALRQCEDDELLQKSGLQPYTSSLKRYLFCASCSASGPGDFYVKERVGTDPPTVSDQGALIHAFGRYSEKGDPDTRFPCPGCPHHAECYEPGNLATARIAVLSFYPFYMLAFEAMSLCAPDFLALLSGASFDDLAAFLQAKGQPGRLDLVRGMGERGAVGVPFLFEREERWFLEVLYLKLSFLGEVLRILAGRSDILRHPEMAPSTERLWVKIADQGGLLPYLWNFQVQLMDVGSGTPGILIFPDPPGSFGLHVLGLTWLEALLTNQRQGSGRVHDALKQAVDACPLEDDRFVDRNFRGRKNPAFVPENIFWEPDGKKVNNAWDVLWEKALRLGWDLLAASCGRGPAWSAEMFQGKLESLRREVCDALFPKSLAAVQPAGPAGGQERAEPPNASWPRTDEDKAIRGIVQRIHAAWKGAAEGQRKGSGEELEKTMMLSSAGAGKPQGPGRSDEKSDEKEEEVFMETVLLSSAEAPKGSPVPSATLPSAALPHEEGEKKPPVDAEEETLGKTVFLDAVKLRGKGKDGSKK
jgi:hypothetical protein